jgi:hypothetical protein
MSQRSFASLAPVSKRFLPIARSRLYHRPIVNTYTVSWDTALALVTSLRSALGRLVVSLHGIIHLVARIGELPEPTIPLPFQLRGYTKTFSLYYELLKSCPKVTHVELISNSKKHFSKLLQALEPSVPYLKTVMIGNSNWSSSYRITEDLARFALNHEYFGGIENLVVDGIGLGVAGEPSLNLRLKSFHIECDMFIGRSSKALFPQTSATLESFSIISWQLRETDLKWIIEYLPSTLKKFSIFAPVTLAFRPSDLVNYRTIDARLVPPSTFSHFTALTHVSMRAFDGPSLALLEVLASASPTLTVLDFSSCKWIASPPTPTPVLLGSSISYIADPDDLFVRLREFKQLRKAHLGLLPSADKGTYEQLAKDLQKLGIEAKWDISFYYHVCPHCDLRYVGDHICGEDEYF